MFTISEDFKEKQGQQLKIAMLGGFQSYLVEGV